MDWTQSTVEALLTLPAIRDVQQHPRPNAEWVPL